MSDIIQLLPDSVANQIAAGEVIQRPSSVVKELVENALDAGADEITIHIKDAGKTLIKITDNGCGMSPTDARMAFERHATSKISTANDLFCIRTMGFRGEALASIAAISDVELRAKRTEDELGTFVRIMGSEVKTQEPAASSNGTSITVKNLFYNVPARRKFLKSNTTELKHIINEIQRIAIPNPEVKFSFFHNYSSLYELGKSNFRRRITEIFSKSINHNLVPVREETSMVNISGYIGQPKYARKTMGEQFFFVNKRFMRHPYFHKAVMQAYEKLLLPDSFPSYFLNLNLDPANIDINVHPTKTEIKFENDVAIWQIIHAAVRESLGKHNIVPSIDFDQRGSIEIPVKSRGKSNPSFPEIRMDPEYNPFEKDSEVSFKNQGSAPNKGQTIAKHWEELYGPPETKFSEDNQSSFHFDQKGEPSSRFKDSGKKMMQFKQKFIEVLKSESIASQQQLFPQTIELEAGDAELLKNILNDLLSLGFDIREFGKNTFVVNGIPGVLDVSSPEMIVEKLLEEYKNSPVNARKKARKQVAVSLSKASALDYGIDLKPEEIDHLIDNLFACSTPNYSPEGKKVLVIIPIEDIEKLFNK